jgi:4-diphosphocytidyl-2-C-methyl-D-erythritol kinase
MTQITLDARAKINLALDVVGKRPDGYHDLVMVMQQLELCDRVMISSDCKMDDITVGCSNGLVPCDQSNIAYRAARLIKDTYSIDRRVEIFIDKRIPVAAGLAGGSADAAAVIRGLNRIWNLGMDIGDMSAIGSKLGADVPFCIIGGTAFAEGIGDILTPIDAGTAMDILLVKPEIMVSTAWVYKNLDISSIKQRPNIDGMILAIKAGDRRRVAQNLCNVLETVTAAQYPVIEHIKEEMMNAGALGAVMTGSGPTVAGIFDGYDHCMSAAADFRKRFREVIVTKSVVSVNNPKDRSISINED